MQKESPLLETGKFELWRRLLLLFMGVVGIWLYMYASPAPLVRIEIVNFEREQERETSGPHVSDRQVHLAAMPLQEYIDIITEDNLIELEGEKWGNFVNQAGATVEGQIPGEWRKRIIAEQMERGFSRYVFFRPDEAPVSLLIEQIGASSFPVYLKGQTSAGGEPLYFRMNFITISHDDFSPGSGYRGLYEPPPAFFRPLRPYSYIFFLAGLLLYLFLPRPHRGPEDMAYSSSSVIGMDLASVILFIPFFGLPLFIIGGSVQSLTVFLPGTLAFWIIAILALWLVYISSWYASFALAVDEKNLVLSHYGGESRIPWNDIEYFQPAEKRAPRWLMILALLAMVSARSSASQVGTASRATMLFSSVTYGYRLHHRSGNWMDIWLTNSMGGPVLNGSEKLEAFLQKAGIDKSPDVAMDYTLSYATRGMADRKKTNWRTTMYVLGTFVLIVFASLLHTNQNMQTASAFLEEEHYEEIPEPEHPVFDGISAVEANISWMELFGGKNSDYGVAAIMNEDGEYLVAGVTKSFGYFSDSLYLIATTTDGEPLWEISHGTARGFEASDIIQTAEGGYALSATVGDFSNRNAHLSKVDTSGEVERGKNFVFEENSRGNSLVAGSEDGFVIAGNQGSYGFLMKTDSQGEQLWLTSLGTDSDSSEANQVLFLPNEDYLVVGSIFNAGTTYWDLYLAQVDRDGNIIWERTHGGYGEERGKAAMLSDDEGAIITGYFKEDARDYEEVYLLAVDGNGEMIWEKTYPSPGHNSQGISVQRAPGEGYLVLVTSYEPSPFVRASLLLINPEGELEAVESIWDESNIIAHSMTPVGEGEFIITGMIGAFGEPELGSRCLYLIKYKMDDNTTQ